MNSSGGIWEEKVNRGGFRRQKSGESFFLVKWPDILLLLVSLVQAITGMSITCYLVLQCKEQVIGCWTVGRLPPPGGIIEFNSF